MTAQKIVVVTGANRGIGLAICEAILSYHNPVKLYACSRAGKNLDLKYGKDSAVEYPKLDINQSSQIKQLASSIESTEGRVDVLINNAGLNKANASNSSDANEIMDINYRGTLSMCETFLPLMTKDGRIVNVSSTASNLQAYSQAIQDKFRDPSLEVGDVNDLANQYLKALESGNMSEWGNKQVYSVSKACMNAVTAVLARENPGLAINCCCPGWVDTEMGNIVGRPPKTPAEGARIPVRLGIGDIGGVSGKYWSNPGVYDTGDGQVKAW